MSMLAAQKMAAPEVERLLNSPHISRSGCEFTPSEDRWQLVYHGDSGVSMSKIEALFEEEVAPYFRLAAARFSGVNSGDSVLNVLKYMSMIVNDHPGINILDPIQFISLKAKRGQKQEYQLSTLRGFFRYWHSSGLWGVSNDFIDATQNIVFSGNEKGRAVKESCPYQGPFTPIEMSGILSGINNAYGTKRISISDYLLVKLLAELGVRRRQVAELVFGDFRVEDNKLTVSMPRGKQRGEDYREQFTDFDVSEDLYQAVLLCKEQVTDELSEIQSDIGSIAEHLPVFPRFNRFLVGQVRSRKDITAEHHETRNSLSSRLDRIARVIDIRSERTGECLHLSASRFRRTLATDLVREGYGLGLVQRALDHTDNQNVGVYAETAAEIATRIDMRIGKLMAPLAQAFAGVIVKSENSAIRGTDATSRIRTLDGHEAIGNCGDMGFCGAAAPVACYTCVKFQPWLDAPHEEVLVELYEDRKRHLEITGDETIAGILDRQILAVEDVINRCAAMKQEMALDSQGKDLKHG
ncbi:site-specific integrase [Marinobacter nauticus]|uniref:site-specific integrase n=1 Tax=Marinobacter nauticus TaxID=2743 RepID=UPI000EB10B9F|nr:site-specific integrase [Marinobacter nauticus]RKR70995.1 phage integrase family protein [Marinobacter nauticus]